MQRFEHPPILVDPYPQRGTKVKGFRYDTALVLIRPKDAPKMRDGEDADYIVGWPYAVSWHSGDGIWRQIVVPEGFLTDLTSVPRLLRWVAGRVGPWLEAAVVHDYLYVAWQDLPEHEPTRENRRFADDIMYAAMKEADVNWVMRGLIHAAVSVFGARVFNQPNEKRYVALDDPELKEQLGFLIPRSA